MLKQQLEELEKAIDILEGCDEDQTIEHMRTQIQKYIQTKYLLDITLLDIDVELLYKHIVDNNLFTYLKDCSEEWISNIIEFIKVKFNYDMVCANVNSKETPLDIFTKEDLQNIIKEKELYIGLNESDAIIIIDIINIIICKYDSSRPF